MLNSWLVFELHRADPFQCIQCAGRVEVGQQSVVKDDANYTFVLLSVPNLRKDINLVPVLIEHEFMQVILAEDRHHFVLRVDDFRQVQGNEPLCLLTGTPLKALCQLRVGIFN